MNVQYAGNQFMSNRLVEVIQELRDYLGPEAHGGLSDEAVACARRWTITGNGR